MRKWILLAAAILNLNVALADTPAPGVVKSKTYDYLENGITSTPVSGHTGLDVNLIGSPTLSISNGQGAPNTPSNAWPFYLTNSTGTNLVGVTSAGALKVDGSGATQPISGGVNVNNFPTVFGATQSTSPWVVGGNVDVGNFPSSFIVNQGTSPWVVSGTVSVSGLTGPLAVTQDTSPWVIAGTVTSNIGTTGGLALDSSVMTVDSGVVALSAKFGSLGQKTMSGSAPVVIASDQSAIPVSGSLGRTWNLSNLTDSVNVGNFPSSTAVTQTTSPWVVSGTVTSNIGTTGGLALDSSLTTINSSIGSLSAKFGSIGQKTMANSAPVVIASDQSSLPVTVSNFPASVNVGNFPSSFGATQATTPWVVSGTVAATQSGAWATGRTWSLLNTTDSVNVGNFPASFGRTWTLSSGTDSVAVTGAVTANIGTTNGLALNSTVALPQGSVGGGPAGTASELAGGVYNSTAPTLTNGQQAGLQLDSSGNLKIAGTLMLSGTVASTQSGAWNVGQAGTWTVQQGTPPWSVSQSGLWNTGRTWTLSNSTDSVDIGNFPATQPVSATSLPLPTNAAQESGGHLASIDSKIPTMGQATMAASIPVVLASNQSSVAVTPTQSSGSNLHVDVDNFPSTQTIAGTVTSNQGTANTLTHAWPVIPTDGTNPITVKAASTAPTVSDTSLVVALSPNSPISVTSVPPTNTNVLGTLTAACSSGSGCSAGSTVQVNADGNTTLGFETHGTWVATITQDVSYDTTCTSSPGTVLWYQTAAIVTTMNQASYANVWGNGLNNIPWVMSVAGTQCARLRAVSYTSGTVDVTLSSGVGTAAVFAVDVGNIGSGSTDAGNPIKVGGVYHLTQPTFGDGQRADLQLDVNGNVRTRPLTASDTVTADQGGVWTTGRTWNLSSGSDSVSAVQSGSWDVAQSGTWTVNADQSGTWNINNISGTISLPTGAATNAELITINSTLGSPFQAGGSIGNSSFGATQSTASLLNATVVTTGGATIAKDSSLTTINSTLGSPMQQTGGTVTANAGTGTFTVGQSSGANLHVDVDNFPATQAVTQSGAWTVAATESGTWNINNITGTVSLPTGAATNSELVTINSTLGAPFQAGGSIGNTTFASTQSGTWTVQQGGAPWSQNVTQFGGSSVVTGTGASGAGIPRVTVSSDSSIITTPQTASTASLTSVTNAITTTSVLASNSSRKGLIIVNDSNTTCFIAFAASASTTAYSVRMTANANYSMPLPTYTGAVSEICNAANGALRVTEF